MSNPPRDTLTIELYEQPGHLIRRAQQIAVSMFFDALGRDVTPVQYTVLRRLQALTPAGAPQLSGGRAPRFCLALAG